MFLPLYDENPPVRTPLATLAIIAANIAAFLWLSQLPDDRQTAALFQYGFVPARTAQLQNGQPMVVAIGDADGPHFWPGHVAQRRLVLPPAPREILLSALTCMFLHGSWMHLAGNLWFFWIFGNNVEDRLGFVPFVVLYVVGGLLATAAHWASDPTSTAPIIGASGAIAAILGAYAIAWPWARVRTLVFLVIFFTVIDVPALLVLGVWFLGQVVAGTEALGRHGVAGGVAWWAHIGGFVAGVLLMPLFGAATAPPRQQRPTW